MQAIQKTFLTITVTNVKCKRNSAVELSSLTLHILLLWLVCSLSGIIAQYTYNIKTYLLDYLLTFITHIHHAYTTHTTYSLKLSSIS